MNDFGKESYCGFYVYYTPKTILFFFFLKWDMQSLGLKSKLIEEQNLCWIWRQPKKQAWCNHTTVIGIKNA